MLQNTAARRETLFSCAAGTFRARLIAERGARPAPGRLKVSETCSASRVQRLQPAGRVRRRGCCWEDPPRCYHPGLTTAPGRFEPVVSAWHLLRASWTTHARCAGKTLQTLHEIRQPASRLSRWWGCGGNRDAAKCKHHGQLGRPPVQPGYPDFRQSGALRPQRHSGADAGWRNCARFTKFQPWPVSREANSAGCSWPGLITLVAGKGHENYQENQRRESAFDDKLILIKFLLLWARPTANCT
jgi:hypothetical protein